MPSKALTFLFFHNPKNGKWFVLIYVDNLILTGNNPTSLKRFVQELDKLFALKDLASLHLFLGIEVTRDDTGFYLTQTKYIEELLKRADMENSKPCSTPAILNAAQTAQEEEPLKNPTSYRKIIGSLQYLTHTRPDIAFIINKPS